MEEQDPVGGRYRLLRVIGAGGTGRVWLAEDELLGRRVAVKEIRTPAGATAPLDVQRATIREARAAARLDHPGVVHVYDVIRRPGTSWIVMEYVPSRSLRDALPLPHADAARIGLAVLAALRAAHAAGVLHRDVKPHNVLLADDGRVVLSDFGLAGLEGTDPSPETAFGSPHYVAPERVRGDGSGAAADLWSLGATLYAAVEGRPPFARATTLRSLEAVLHEPPDPPSRPGPLTPVIAALLTKDPARRLTADQAEAQLRRAADRVIGVVPRHRLPATAITVAAARPAHRLARSTRIALATAGVLLLGTTGTALALDAATPDRQPPRAAPTAPAAICDDGAAPGSAVTADRAVRAYGLPPGWGWHRDPAGFEVAVPVGWTRRSDGRAACFRDPGSGRSFEVRTGVPAVASPVEHWRLAERRALADGELPGYRLIGMTPLSVGRGGAAWEFTWQPEPGVRRHERRLLLTVGPDRAYAIGWVTRDQDWAADEPLLQLVVASLS